jgi:hypothetical protein
MGARSSREVGNFLCGARVTVASHEVRAWYRAVQDTACAAEGDAAPWAAKSFSLIAVGFWAVQAGFGRSPSLVHVAARVGRCYHDRADDARALVDADMAL